MQKQKYLQSLLLLAFLFSPQAQAESLLSVLKTAIVHHPDVLTIKNQRDTRRFDVKQAQAGYLPTLDLNAGIGYEYTDSPATRPKDDEELKRGEFGLILRQNLYDGMATDAEVARQLARLEASDYLLDAAINDTALAVVEQYINVLRYREILNLAQDNRKVHLRIQDQIRLRSEAGVGRGADYDQIKARVSLVEANLIAAEVNLRDALTNYKKIVGVKPREALSAVPTVVDQLPSSLSEAFELSKTGNFTYLSSASDVLQAQAQQKASRANDYPRVDLELSTNFNHHLNGINGYSNNLSAMLRMRYNLYNGGADQALKASTSSQIQEAEEIRRRSYRQVEETLGLAWAAYEATSRQIGLLQKQVDYSVSTRDAYVKQFNIGQRTLLDLLNTENELFQAKESLIVAKTDNLFAQYRILAVMGKIAEVIGLAISFE